MNTEPVNYVPEEARSEVSQTSNDIESASSTGKKRVRFSNVVVRLHNVVCTGFVSHGPSIGLDWFSVQSEPVCLDEYEDTVGNRRKSKASLKLCPLQRTNLLVKGFGYSPKDLRKAGQRHIPSTPRRTVASAQRQQRSNGSGIRQPSALLGSARMMMPRSLL